MHLPPWKIFYFSSKIDVDVISISLSSASTTPICEVEVELMLPPHLPSINQPVSLTPVVSVDGGVESSAGTFGSAVSW